MSALPPLPSNLSPPSAFSSASCSSDMLLATALLTPPPMTSHEAAHAHAHEAAAHALSGEGRRLDHLRHFDLQRHASCVRTPRPAPSRRRSPALRRRVPSRCPSPASTCSAASSPPPRSCAAWDPGPRRRKLSSCAWVGMNSACGPDGAARRRSGARGRLLVLPRARREQQDRSEQC